MRTITVALATALLFWAGLLLQAQTFQQFVVPGFSKIDTATVADTLNTKKATGKKFALQSLSNSLGSPAGQKSAGNSKRETDSLQQVILLRKKF